MKTKYKKESNAIVILILKWVIDGARNIIDAEYKLTPPGRVQAAIDNYMEQNNWLKHFIDECCEVDALNEEKSGELYQEYRNYCIRSGELRYLLFVIPGSN